MKLDNSGNAMSLLFARGLKAEKKGGPNEFFEKFKPCRFALQASFGFDFEIFQKERLWEHNKMSGQVFQIDGCLYGRV